MEICWNVTSKCNIDCHHCFRIRNEKELNYKEIIGLMDKLKTAGVDAISFSGGEFFINKNAKDILKASREKGFSTSVTTNASLITPDKFDEIKSFLDRITFSLEFINDKENERFGRGKNYFSHLSRIISHVNNMYPDFKIKINTAVTKENLNHLKDISNELEKYNIESWKLMEFCPLRGDAIENKARLEIPHEIFESTAYSLQKKSNLNIKIFSREKTENQAVITPSGQLIYSKNDNDIVLLNNLCDQSISSINRSLAIIEGKKLKHYNIHKNNENQMETGLNSK